MLKTILIYGLLLGAMIIFLQYIEYSFLIKSHVVELYIGLIAGVFLLLGWWFGRLFREKKALDGTHLPQPTGNFTTWGISKREYEVLVLLGQGMSNQQIADTLFVSTNTIKTHTSKLFEKLGVKNRTQALLKAKELGLIS